MSGREAPGASLPPANDEDPNPGWSMKPQPEQPAEPVRPLAAPLDEAMSRRQFIAAAGAGGALLLLPGVPESASAARRVWTVQPDDGVVIQWSEAFLQGVRD